jgi:hypothetical protein
MSTSQFTMETIGSNFRDGRLLRAAPSSDQILSTAGWIEGAITLIEPELHKGRCKMERALNGNLPKQIGDETVVEVDGMRLSSLR